MSDVQDSYQNEKDEQAEEQKTELRKMAEEIQKERPDLNLTIEEIEAQII